ncbi:MAG: ribosomal-processing cysteine protease Prp [Eubacterium sp.]|nr:ribosomal-processing cysteine protease Prp [Eubacterium sp.]
MTKITVYKNNSNQYMGFKLTGHSGFAEEGEDIVCAGISVLAINTVNSIEQLTKQQFTMNDDEQSGDLEVRLASPAQEDTALLIESMILGLTMIRKQYGNNYITLKFEEV